MKTQKTMWTFVMMLTAAAVLSAGSALAQGVDTADPTLPPDDGVYRSPADVHAEFHGPGLDIITKSP